MNEQGVSVRLEVNEDCWSMCTKWMLLRETSFHATHEVVRFCTHLRSTVLKRICMTLLPLDQQLRLWARLGRALRQGWRPVRGKTRQRGFSAAPSPAPQGDALIPHLGPLIRRQI